MIQSLLDMWALIWPVARGILGLVGFLSAAVFGATGVVGLFRFPDPWSRLQASSLAGTTAVLSILFSALVLSPSWEMAFRVLLLIGFFLISSPTGTHIIARFAWNAGLQPWRPRGDKK